MCNNYRLLTDISAISEDFAELKVKIGFPEAIPNWAPNDNIRITDSAPIIRAAADPDAAELVMRRWSWPGPTGKPVYNFRSEGRSFGEGRCLIPTDGFFEFTDAPATDGGPKKKLKDKWLFEMKDHRVFCIAGIWRTSQVGEAFTMLTTEPGPDVAPYHSRQVVVLPRTDSMRWLNPAIDARDVLGPAPAGTLSVSQIR